jgi:hypothetical protein
MHQRVYDQQVTLHPTKPPDLYPHPQAQWTSQPTTCNQQTAKTARNSHQKLIV